MDVCRLCGDEVKRVITELGKRRDLDPAPHEDGNHLIVTHDPGGWIRARVLAGPDLPCLTGDAYKEHACTTGPGAPKPPPGPACSRCQAPMPADIAKRLRWDCHPACEPAFLRELADQAAHPDRKPRIHLVFDPPVTVEAAQAALAAARTTAA